MNRSISLDSVRSLFRRGPIALAGWIFLALCIPLGLLLPATVGETGPVEILQLVVLVCGMVLCLSQAARRNSGTWSPHAKYLWISGALLFLVLVMRETSCGRAYCLGPDGLPLRRSEWGVLGKLEHPAYALVMLACAVCALAGNCFKALRIAMIPTVLLVLGGMFAIVASVAEVFDGEHIEELAELGFYCVLVHALCDTIAMLRHA